MSKWVLSPLNDQELREIRQKLEDGDIPSAEKYAVIQRLIEGHLLANRLTRQRADEAYAYAEKLDKIQTILGVR